MSNDPKQLGPEDSPSPVRPLDYRAGAVDRGPVRKGQVVAGAVIGIAVTMLVVFIGIIVSLSERLQTSIGAFLLVAGIGALAINAWAALAYRSTRWRGLGIGLWIGFGLALLIEGACFGFGKI